MKRLSVRLAAGAAVIMLGLLAVAQAQRDRQLDSETEWDLNTEPDTAQPSAPLAAESEPSSWPASPDTDVYRGNDPTGPADETEGETGPRSEYGAVQLAAHEQAADSNDDVPNLSLGMPVASDDEPADGPGMSAPATSSFSLPEDYDEASEAASQSPAALEVPADAQPVDNAQPAPEAEMATIQADSGPAFSMNFTGIEEDEEPATDLDGDSPAATEDTGMSAESNQAGTTEPSASRNLLRSSPATASPAEDDAMEPPSDMREPSGSPYQFQAAEVVTLPSEEKDADRVDVPSAESTGPDDARYAADNEPARMVGGPMSAAASGSFQAEGYGGVQSQGSHGQQAAGQAAAGPMARVASGDSNQLPQLDQIMAAPGDRRLDGAQAPSIVIHKRAPEEVNVGKPATFIIEVQNVGTTEALNVRILDRVPQGMRLADATPSPERDQDLLTWSLGAIEPGGVRSLSMQLIPEQEGELGSVARVTFEAAASVRTISTRPELRITQRAPEKVLIGQQLEIEIQIKNVGTGAASNVVLQADVPEGLEHPKGRQLDNLIGTLAPGESRNLTLRLRATGAGTIENLVELVAADGLTAQHVIDVDVVAPNLVVELQGPSRRYLERQATYNVSIANRGTAAATDVELVATLDRGFTFVSTDFEGQYDPTRHAVYWSLAELPAGEQGLVPLTLLPIEEGEQMVRLEAAADLGMEAQSEKRVTVDTLAELTFSVADRHDPIEVSSETTYEIRVKNAGSRDDTNVQLRVELPAGLELQSADREAGTDDKGMVVFEPLARIAPEREEVFRIRVRGKQPGTHVIKAVLTSDQAPVAVTKEESTRVYEDE